VDLAEAIRSPDIRPWLIRPDAAHGRRGDSPNRFRQAVWIELDVKVELITPVSRNLGKPWHHPLAIR
jgi:hypothetical protein